MSMLFSSLSEQESSLHLLDQIGNHLRQRNWQVSCAESCTGGGLAYTLTSIAGSSDWFSQSWVTYSNEAKQHLLGVEARTLEQYGAVSAETVREMAVGCAMRANAQVGIATSGIAGPGGGTESKPVGTVWFGFWLNGEPRQVHKQIEGDRYAVRNQAIRFCCDYLHQWLVEQ